MAPKWTTMNEEEDEYKAINSFYAKLKDNTQ